jgi:thioredoxin-related protein
MNIYPHYKVALLIIFSLFFSNFAMSTEAARGEIIGASAHVAPSWFKDSFLDIADDVDEAAESGRHVLLFFQLNGCPYCDRMLVESFEAEPLTSFIQQHFDTIAINVRGDREIAFNENLVVTEKQLSSTLNVRATPAIVILDENNKQVVRVNGYRAPERFKHILEYVQSKSYKTIKLAEYIQAHVSKDIYKTKSNALFANITDLSIVKGPLMVIFEDSSCYDCQEFYGGLLANALVQKEMAAYTIVRVDASSNQALTDIDGEQTTANKLVNKYQMIYRPGVLVFNEGKLLRRHDSLTFPHHFKESLRYVAGEFYKTQTYSDYSQKRTEELLSQGINIDLSQAKIK